jgi:hypothetical protein
VQDRRHYIPHSGYLTTAFANQYWIPFFNPAPQQQQPVIPRRSSWLLALNWLPVPAITVALVGLAGFAVYFAADRIIYSTFGTIKIPNTTPVNFEVLGYRSKDDRSPEVVYSARNNTATGVSYSVHDLASNNKYVTIVIKVGNRRSFDCEPKSAIMTAEPLENIGGEQSVAKTAPENANPAQPVGSTKYEIDLSSAYRAFGRAKLEFEYNDNFVLATSPSFRADKLTVYAGGRLDYRKIKVDAVEHAADTGKCDEYGVPYPAGTSPFVAMAPVKVEPKGLLSLFVSSVWASETDPIDSSNIDVLLNDPNPERRAIAVDAIIARPDRFAEKVGRIVQTSDNADAVADVIRASRNVLPSPIKLNESRILELSYAQSLKVRDSARSYLRAPNVVSSEIAALFEGEKFQKLVKELRSRPVADRPYAEDYLLLITARDVFYNLGLKELGPVLEKIRRREKLSPGEKETVLKRFDAGAMLQKLARNPDERIALSKNTYGRALAMLELAVNIQAAENASKESVYQYIAIARKASQPLANKAASKEIETQFAKFLNEIAVKRELYPWPPHIEQATRCRALVTFACLSTPPP